MQIIVCLIEVTDKINAEETVGKKIQRKKNEKVSNVELSEDPQAAQLQGESFGFDGFRSVL
jgi:ribosomal RNA-processing protein 7